MSLLGNKQNGVNQSHLFMGGHLGVGKTKQDRKKRETMGSKQDGSVNPIFFMGNQGRREY